MSSEWYVLSHCVSSLPPEHHYAYTMLIKERTHKVVKTQGQTDRQRRRERERAHAREREKEERERKKRERERNIYQYIYP
jgi:hypothetical protein